MAMRPLAAIAAAGLAAASFLVAGCGGDDTRASDPRRLGSDLEGHTGNLGGYVGIVWTTANADRIVVLMGNSDPLTPEADAAIHRTLDDAFCGATD